MARRSPQTAMKRAREQKLREKRELKQARKDARAAGRVEGADFSVVSQAADANEVTE